MATLFCVEHTHMTKFYLHDVSKEFEKEAFSKELVTPEGQPSMCLIFRTKAALPKKLPFFEYQLFWEQKIGLDEFFLRPGEDVGEEHGDATYSYVCKLALADRPCRHAALAAIPSFKEIQHRIKTGIAKAKADENHRLEQMRLAGEGRAADTHGTITTSASRLARKSKKLMGKMKAQGKAAAKGLKTPRKTKKGIDSSTAVPSDGSPLSRLVGGSMSVLSGGGGGDGAFSVIASTMPPPVPSPNFRGSASQVAGSQAPMAAGAAAASRGTAAAESSGSSEWQTGQSAELLPLITSTHGNVFPTIPAILSGTAIKRELGGVPLLVASSTDTVPSCIVLDRA